MSLSLGFNQMRPQRIHSLPGATYSQAAPPPRRRVSSSTRENTASVYSAPSQNTTSQPQVVHNVPLHSTSTPLLSRRMQFLEDAFKKSAELAEQFRNTRDEASQTMQQMYEQLQIVYGVTETDIKDETSFQIVARKGEQIALCYPMTQTKDNKIIMKAKLVDSVTAKITLVDVCVFDPSASVKHKIAKFTAFPKQ